MKLDQPIIGVRSGVRLTPGALSETRTSGRSKYPGDPQLCPNCAPSVPERRERLLVTFVGSDRAENSRPRRREPPKGIVVRLTVTYQAARCSADDYSGAQFRGLLPAWSHCARDERRCVAHPVTTRTAPTGASARNAARCSPWPARPAAPRSREPRWCGTRSIAGSTRTGASPPLSRWSETTITSLESQRARCWAGRVSRRKLAPRPSSAQ
jgi:hypothetical protein